MITAILAWIGGVTAVVILLLVAFISWAGREQRNGRNPFL